MNSALYLTSLSLPNLVTRLPGGAAQGLIWGLMALGLYITFRVLDFADLTVDGSFATGGAVTVMLILGGYSPAIALAAAVLAGMLAGLVTGLFHTKLGIPAILAGILTQFALYSVNLHIMGMAANKPVNPDKQHLLITMRDVPLAIVTGGLFAIGLVWFLYWYFGTEQGSAVRATGSNPNMSRAQGINVNNMKLIGLSLSNGIIALSGGLMAQFQGFADINMGRGAIVIGLAAVIIGEVICDAIFRKGCRFLTRLSFVVFGGVMYYTVMVIILWLKLDPNDLKLFTALIVAVFLAVPYLRAKSKSSFRLAGKQSGKERQDA